MARYVALLRGINLGSRRRIAMADLRALLSGLGYTAVRTHLQSGNAVFTAEDAAPAEVAAGIEARIARDLDMSVAVVVRTAQELREVVARNPLDVPEPARFLVSFLAGPVPAGRFDDVDPAAYAPEELHVGRRELYMSLPDGIQKAKLPPLVEKRVPGEGTARNWNTVLKLVELAEAED
jgi:uncharacterized protein (DUF1697 family)